MNIFPRAQWSKETRLAPSVISQDSFATMLIQDMMRDYLRWHTLATRIIWRIIIEVSSSFFWVATSHMKVESGLFASFREARRNEQKAIRPRIGLDE